MGRKEEIEQARKDGWVDGWMDRKSFETDLLDAVTNELRDAGIMTKDHSDILLQIRADLGNDGARFDSEEEE